MRVLYDEMGIEVYLEDAGAYMLEVQACVYGC